MPLHTSYTYLNTVTQNLTEHSSTGILW